MTMKCRSNIDDSFRPCRIGVLLPVMLGVALGPASGVWGQCEVAKLLPDDLFSNSQIGRILDISGDIAVIGSDLDPENGTRAGAAYVYRFDGSSWTLQQKLLAPDGEPADRFGFSVAVSEGIVAVGSPNDDDAGEDSGAVYVFEFDGKSWVLHSKLYAEDASPNDGFMTVAISGDAMVVGAYRDDDEHGYYSGSAYIFRFNGSQWLQEDKLVPEIGHPADWFGWKVDISGDIAVIGAWGDDTHGQESGSANVFRFNPKTSAWVEEQRFEPNGSGTYQDFGRTVAVWGDTVLIGARGDDDAGFNAGATYAFHYDGSEWSLVQKILPPSDGLHLGFGWSVTMSAEVAVIGLSWLPSSAGAAEVYRRIGTAWKPQQMLVPSDGEGGDQFGFEVAMSGDTVVIGSRWDDDDAHAGGSAYVFDLDQPILDCNDNLVDDVCETAAGISVDCNANSVPDECDIASGDSSDVNGNGIPDECDADLDGDGSVGVKDLLILLGSWGPCDNCNDCIADLDDDCTVGVVDLLMLLGNWG